MQTSQPTNGFQITFFTQEDRKHNDKPLGEWLIQLAKEMELRGATLLKASVGVGHDGRFHSANFFELADQPLQVIMAVDKHEAERLFQRLKAEGVHLFYVKTPIEFGTLGGDQ
jgi:PII-like signaling protein